MTAEGISRQITTISLTLDMSACPETAPNPYPTLLFSPLQWCTWFLVTPCPPLEASHKEAEPFLTTGSSAPYVPPPAGPLVSHPTRSARASGRSRGLIPRRVA